MNRCLYVSSVAVSRRSLRQEMPLRGGSREKVLSQIVTGKEKPNCRLGNEMMLRQEATT